MVGESLTTRLARERLDAIKIFIPDRDRVREKLQARQQLQTDFASGTEQLFKSITIATKNVKAATERAIYGDIPGEETKKKAPLLGVLEKIAPETGQTKKTLETLPVGIVTTGRQQQRKERALEELQQRQRQQELKELEELLEQIEKEKQQKDQPQEEEDQPQEEEEDQPQNVIGKGTTPKEILTKDALAEIRGIGREEELADFAARNFEKKIRANYIIGGREYEINDIDDWSRVVFLAHRNLTRLPPGDNEYRVFKERVRMRLFITDE